MRKKKSFLIVFTAIVLMLSLPFSSSALSITDSDMSIYRPVDKVSGRELGEFPAVGVWYKFTCSEYSSVGIYDSGRPDYAFIIWIPTKGYYLISIQSMEMQKQLQGTVNPPSGDSYTLYGTLFISKNSEGGYTNSYYNWRGDGTYALQYDQSSHFQTSFFGSYIVFHKIFTKSNNGTPQRGTNENFEVPKYGVPDDTIKDKVQQIINSYLGGQTAIYINGSSSITSTYPNGEVVPTGANGQPVVTNEYGEPVSTNKYGYPDETYPNGNPVVSFTQPNSSQIYTVPYDEIASKPYETTILDNGEVSVIYPQIVDNGEVDSDVSNEFSKLNSMIADLDDLSSMMESNQADMSSHVDGTRNLIDSVLGWFPTPVIACMICGAIMIIAVKLTGSGKS